MLFLKLIILGGNEVTKVELFETIRKKFFHHQKTIRQIAKEEQVHRRTVRRQLIMLSHQSEKLLINDALF